MPPAYSARWRVSFVTRRFLWRGAVEPFLMELPDLQAARTRRMSRATCLLRGKIFIVRAGRIIFR
jgi:ferrous iron transport protein B